MRAPDTRTAQLEQILSVTLEMASTTDLDSLLERIVAATLHVLDCERATIFLYDPRQNELFSRVATGVESIRFPADRGIAGAAASARNLINVPDAYADNRFNPEIDRKTGFKTHNLLTFPLENLDGQLMGVLQALNKRHRPFDENDEHLARLLSAQAGVAIHRWRLLEAYAEKQRMQRDLEIARSIQLRLLPKENPRLAAFEVAGWNRSADETGGDCYDFIPLPDGRLAILLADATGHGIGAALVIAQFRSSLRALLSLSLDLPAVTEKVNDLIAPDIGDERFVTAFIGLLDPHGDTMEYVAAGQGPLLVVRTDHAETMRATGPPLGIEVGMPYRSARLAFTPGMQFALLTDGFYEAHNHAQDEFGENRVVAHLRENAATALDASIETLHQKIRQFVGNAPQADDLTAVIIRRRPH